MNIWKKFKPKDNNNLEKVDKKEIKNLAKFASLRIFQHLMRNKIDDENPVENLPRALYKSVGVLSKEDKNQKKKEKKAKKMEQKAKKKARNIKTKETKEKNEKGKNKIEYVSDILEIIINKICSVKVSTKSIKTFQEIYNYKKFVDPSKLPYDIVGKGVQMLNNNTTPDMSSKTKSNSSQHNANSGKSISGFSTRSRANTMQDNNTAQPDKLSETKRNRSKSYETLNANSGKNTTSSSTFGPTTTTSSSSCPTLYGNDRNNNQYFPNTGPNENRNNPRSIQELIQIYSKDNINK